MLADAAARGKKSARHPRILESESGLIGYGALDFSDDLTRASVVGPIVHPAHRHKGYGRRLLEEIIDQARVADQKEVRATVGGMNQAGRALLKSAGFSSVACNTVLRIRRPETFGELSMDGVEVVQAVYEDADDVHEFIRKLVPRAPKQTRSLLKTNEYVILLAKQRNRVIGFVEVDLRQGALATLEHLDGPPNMLHQGLGNLLLWEAVRSAFNASAVESFEFVVVGNDPATMLPYLEAGFERCHDLVVYELVL